MKRSNGSAHTSTRISIPCLEHSNNINLPLADNNTVDRLFLFQFLYHIDIINCFTFVKDYGLCGVAIFCKLTPCFKNSCRKSYAVAIYVDNWKHQSMGKHVIWLATFVYLHKPCIFHCCDVKSLALQICNNTCPIWAIAYVKILEDTPCKLAGDNIVLSNF